MFSIVMMAFILTSAHSIQFVSAVPGQGTLIGTEAGGGGAIYDISRVNGAASNQVLVAGGQVLAITGIAVDPTNGDVYISTSAGAGDIYRINPATGAILAGPLPTGFPQVGDLSFRSDGTLYAAMSDGVNWGIATINKNTGAPTVLPNPTTLVGMEAIAFGPGDVLYAATKSPNAGGIPGIPGDMLFTIDLNTGLENPGPLPIADAAGAPPLGGVVGLDFGCDGKLYAGTSNLQGQFAPSLLTIDPNTGTYTLKGPTGFGFSLSDLAFDTSGCIVGGEILPLDATSLLLAGAAANLVWITPIVLAGAGFAAFKLRKN